MALGALNIDIAICDGAGAMTGIIPHMFPGPVLHILGNACMPQPVNCGVPQALGLFIEAFLAHPGGSGIETLLHDSTYLAGTGDTTFATGLVD